MRNERDSVDMAPVCLEADDEVTALNAHAWPPLWPSDPSVLIQAGFLRVGPEDAALLYLRFGDGRKVCVLPSADGDGLVVNHGAEVAPELQRPLSETELLELQARLSTVRPDARGVIRELLARARMSLELRRYARVA